MSPREYFRSRHGSIFLGDSLQLMADQMKAESVDVIMTSPQTFTTGSPSVQIDIDCLNRALVDGLAFDRKNNSEIAIGIRPDRQRVVGVVSRLARAASFRQQVKQAYDNRCAVTRMQLRLSDAAHILPAGAPGSVDEVRNGLFLSATYHRAFDAGLIFLDENLTMRLNSEKAEHLATLGLDAGLATFQRSVGRRIHLPPDVDQRPDPSLIRRANAFRQIRL